MAATAMEEEEGVVSTATSTADKARRVRYDRLCVSLNLDEETIQAAWHLLVRLEPYVRHVRMHARCPYCSSSFLLLLFWGLCLVAAVELLAIC